jgi:hypothetical protein
MSRGDLLEWNDALKKANSVATTIARRSWTVIPRLTTPSPQQADRPRIRGVPEKAELGQVRHRRGLIGGMISSRS